MSKYLKGFYLFLLMLCTFSAEARIKAEVDRQKIVLGEAVNLIIRADQLAGNAQPDLIPLRRDFNLISEGEQSQISIINGNSSVSKMWYIALNPRRAGTLTIPAIRIGNETTDPITVEVATAPKDDGDKEAKDIFLKTKIDTDKTNVQGQILYTAQLFYDRNIQNAELSDPQFDDGTVIRLDKDSNFQKTVNGIAYQVIERHYAIVPDKSGDLTIVAPTLTGNVIDRDSLSKSSFEILSTMWEPIRVTAKPITIHVAPIPAGVDPTQWLPAKSLTLSETWSKTPNQFQVGQPITRTITINASGTMADKLPDFSMSDIKGIQAYPDKPIVESSSDGTNLLAKRIEKIAIIPNDSGEIHLPPIELKWWNTAKNKFEVASLPAKTLMVAPASDEKPTDNTATPITKTAAPAEESSTNASEETSSIGRMLQWQNLLWMGIAALLFLLWMVTLWRLKKSKHKVAHAINAEKEATNLKLAKKKCKAACMSNDPQACKVAIQQWAAHFWPQYQFRNIGDVEKVMSLEMTKQLLRELDKALYTNTTANWDGPKLWECLSQEEKKSKRHVGHAINSLPRLYPE